MNLIQFKQVQGLDARLSANDASLTQLSGELGSSIWAINTGNTTFSGIKYFNDSVRFNDAVTGLSSGNFIGGLWVNTNKVLTQADTGTLFVTTVSDQNITGVKTFQSHGGQQNTIFKAGNVSILPWGSAGEISPQLGVSGKLFITGSDGSPLQITSNSPWTTASSEIYYNPTTPRVGIGTPSPLYPLEVRGTGSFGYLNITGSSQTKFTSSVGIGAGASDFSNYNLSSWTSSAGVTTTGAEFVNSAATSSSASAISLLADASAGAGNFGRVQLEAKREDGVGTTSFIVKTKTGIVAASGFEPRFQISGARILADYNAMATGDPQHKGEIWISGEGFLMISSGAA
tara:strand:- start:5372 stop:6403 length:1032 start_codon:yes stop_codon:yes gene_type:complete